MIRAFVVYDSKYGNTKLVAEKIREGLLNSEGVETAIGYIKEINLNELSTYDALIIGAPNHMGGPSITAKKFIEKLSKANVNAKWIAAFDTYLMKEKYYGKAMRKMEDMITQKMPNLKLIKPGLSIKVTGINGPVANGELPKCVEFGKQVASQIKE